NDSLSPKPAPNRNRLRLIAAGVIGLAILAAVGWYVMHLGVQSTDDAQVEADVIAVPSRVGGVVTKVDFAENQMVRAGDVLAALASTSGDSGSNISHQAGHEGAGAMPAQIAQAEARVAAAQAARDLAATELSWTKITAPAGGMASKKSVVAGQMVAPGQPVV